VEGIVLKISASKPPLAAYLITDVFLLLCTFILVYPIKPNLPAVGGNEGCAQVIKVIIIKN